MNTYYLSHPQIEQTAVVEAPSTETARTTFLDYLERNSIISRRQRQSLRKDMIAHRVDDPSEFQPDITLSYGYTEGGTVKLEEPGVALEEVPETAESEEENANLESPVKSTSPIQELAIRTGSKYLL